MTQKRVVTLGIGILGGITLNEHPPRTSIKDPKGREMIIAGFAEKSLLANTTISLGFDISFFNGSATNNSVSSLQIQDSFVIAESKIGSVDISSLRLKIPLRFRFYYLNRERWRVFCEPGAFFLTELSSNREYNYEKTTYYDSITKVPLDPPEMEFITENPEVNIPVLGLSLGLGVELQTAKQRSVLLSLQYQRARLYREARRNVIHHLFALEARFLLQKRTKVVSRRSNN